MRQGCPEFVLKKIPPELAVEFWCRRAAFEFIEELSDALYWSFVIGYFAARLFQASENFVWLLVGSVLIAIWPSRHFFFEFMRWKNEIHVVTRNDERGGGMYFKFSGGLRGLSANIKKDPITDRSPSADVKQSPFFRLWGWFTGESMVRYSLKSDNNMFIDGRKVSPELDSAVDRVRLAVPRSESMELPDSLQWIRALTDLGNRGIRSQEETKHAVDTIINQHVYGQ